VTSGRDGRHRRRARDSAATFARPLVDRPRLDDVLASRFERRLTVLVAGPGFGKSALLAQARQRNAASPRGIDLWFSCRPTHDAASQLGPELAALAGAGPAIDGAADVVGAIADTVWSRAPVDVALVIDDLHHVAPGSSGAELLAALLEALPDNGHLVLSSRTAPPLPVARLESTGQTAWIEEGDLCFTDAELADFASARSVPVEALAGTAGWPALAELAALRREPGPGVRPSVDDYLWEEVLARMEAGRRLDLALIGGLGDVDPELAAAAAGHELDLEALVADLPLVVRAGGGVRLHALWDGALTRLAEPEARAEARTRASAVLAGRGQLADAMRLVAGDGRWAPVRSVLRAAFASGNAPVAADVLRGWQEAMPPERADEPESLLLAAAVANQDGGDGSGGHRSFEAAVEAFRAAGDREGELAALVHWSGLAFRQGDHRGIGRQLARIHELAGEGYEEAHTLVDLGITMVALVRGDWAGALGALDSVRQSALPRELWSAVACLRAQALLGLGEAAEADRVSRQAIEQAGLRYRALAGRTRLLSSLLAGRMEEVTATAQRLAAEADRARWPNSVVLDHAMAAVIACRTGQHAAAREHVAAASQAQGDLDHRTAQAVLAFARAGCAVLAGDEAAAAAVLGEELAERPVGTPGTHLPHLCMLALSYVLVPGTRETWDALPLGPAWVTARTIARALVAVRERDDPGPAERLRPVRPELLRVHLPAPWAVELAVAAHPDPTDAARLLERLGPAHGAWVEGLGAAPAPAVRTRARRFLASVPRPPRERLTLCLLGPMRLLRDGAPVGGGWRQVKVRELLAYLVARPEARRADVIADLWPNLDEEAGANNLRVTLFALRAALEPGRQVRDPSFFVRSEPDRLRLVAGDHLEVDASRFLDRLDEARRASSTAAELEAYLAAFELRRGPYLVELQDAAWTVLPREHLEGRFVAAALRAGELLLGRDPAQALDLAAEVLSVDAASERAFRLQAAAYNRQGARSTARRVLARCRRELRALGLTPEPETEMLERLVGR
jgi:ATP/maltotriose-dependent transcriptional regulator MalT/DNA-binding SARP family transcriptional activator